MDVQARYPDEPRLIVTDMHLMSSHGHFVVERDAIGLWHVWVGKYIRGAAPDSPWRFVFLKDEDVTAQLCGTPDGLPDPLLALRLLENHIRELTTEDEDEEDEDEEE